MLARVADPSAFYRHLGRSVDLKALTTERLGPELARVRPAARRAVPRAVGRRRAAGATPPCAAWTAYGFTHIDPDDEVFAVYAGLDAIACRLLYSELVMSAGRPFACSGDMYAAVPRITPAAS